MGNAGKIFRTYRISIESARSPFASHRFCPLTSKLNINPSDSNLSIDSRPCFLVTLNVHIPWLIKRVSLTFDRVSGEGEIARQTSSRVSHADIPHVYPTWLRSSPCFLFPVPSFFAFSSILVQTFPVWNSNRRIANILDSSSSLLPKGILYLWWEVFGQM